VLEAFCEKEETDQMGGKGFALLYCVAARIESEVLGETAPISDGLLARLRAGAARAKR